MAGAPYGVHINIKEGDEPPVYSDFAPAKLIVHAAYFTEAQMKAMRLDGFENPYDIRDLKINQDRSVIVQGVDGSIAFTRNASNVLSFPLTKAEFEDSKGGLFLWCDPLGAAALRC